MKKALKITGYGVLVIVLVIIGLISYVKIALPNVGPAPELKVAGTPQQIERGKYLATSVTPCLDCHSTRDWSKFGGPIMDGTLGKGGEKFDQQFGFPGSYLARNITPRGISRYTDGELFRVITTGVTKEGRAMFPVMPYMYFGRMDPEDIKCIIAYLRTIPAIDNDVPASVSDFPMNIIINTIPQKANPSKRPDTADHMAYGAYLVNACACRECHTKENKGQIIPELEFQGGREFKFPDGSVVRSANITPSTASGIGNWNEDAFINRFKLYADSNYKPQTVKPGDFNSIMPWLIYSRMNRSDLGAIYTYLHSLPAKENSVVKFSPASEMAKK
jgi:cytochrome c2